METFGLFAVDKTADVFHIVWLTEDVLDMLLSNNELVVISRMLSLWIGLVRFNRAEVLVVVISACSKGSSRLKLWTCGSSATIWTSSWYFLIQYHM